MVFQSIITCILKILKCHVLIQNPIIKIHVLVVCDCRIERVPYELKFQDFLFLSFFYFMHNVSLCVFVSMCFV